VGRQREREREREIYVRRCLTSHSSVVWLPSIFPSCIWAALIRKEALPLPKTCCCVAPIRATSIGTWLLFPSPMPSLLSFALRRLPFLHGRTYPYRYAHGCFEIVHVAKDVTQYIYNQYIYIRIYIYIYIYIYISTDITY
jgi:hypothetical protein